MIPDASDPLAAAAHRGDRSAFEALIRREKAGLYAFVRRYVGDADDSYDVVQDAFVSAWRAIGRYDPNRAFGVWLRTIALNKCRDHGRRGKVRKLVMSAFASEPASPSRTTDRNQTEQDLERLDQAVAKLPAIYKDPLLLTTAGGLSHAEAAQALRISPKAIEMRLYRARHRLAELMAEASEG
jgi:RNA polymerase sigma factor (sigma-70 family)